MRSRTWVLLLLLACGVVAMALATRWPGTADPPAKPPADVMPFGSEGDVTSAVDDDPGPQPGPPVTVAARATHTIRLVVPAIVAPGEEFEAAIWLLPCDQPFAGCNLPLVWDGNLMSLASSRSEQVGAWKSSIGASGRSLAVRLLADRTLPPAVYTAPTQLGILRFRVRADAPPGKTTIARTPPKPAGDQLPTGVADTGVPFYWKHHRGWIETDENGVQRSALHVLAVEPVTLEVRAPVSGDK